MITEDEKFIEIQGILTFSDIHPADCIKINNLIIELSKENKQLKDNWNKLREIIDIKMYNMKYLLNLCGYKVDRDTLIILDIIKKEMKELEKSDSNG